MTVALALAPTAAVAAGQALPVPANALLVGVTNVLEIREFPEESLTVTGAPGIEETLQMEGTDRLYETPSSYGATVAFFDRTLVEGHFAVIHRTTTHTATVWSLGAPDGDPARLAVRNTRPTTIECVTARDETGRSLGDLSSLVDHDVGR
jgi:hypothetical protein